MNQKKMKKKKIPNFGSLGVCLKSCRVIVVKITTALFFYFFSKRVNSIQQEVLIGFSFIWMNVRTLEHVNSLVALPLLCTSWLLLSIHTQWWWLFFIVKNVGSHQEKYFDSFNSFFLSLNMNIKKLWQTQICVRI